MRKGWVNRLYSAGLSSQFVALKHSIRFRSSTRLGLQCRHKSLSLNKTNQKAVASLRAGTVKVILLTLTIYVLPLTTLYTSK